MFLYNLVPFLSPSFLSIDKKYRDDGILFSVERKRQNHTLFQISNDEYAYLWKYLSKLKSLRTV